MGSSPSQKRETYAVGRRVRYSLLNRRYWRLVGTKPRKIRKLVLSTVAGLVFCMPTAAAAAKNVFPAGSVPWNSGTIAESIRGPDEPTALAAPFERVFALQKGDTISSVLAKAGVEHSEARSAISVLRPLFDPTRLQIGQEIALTLAPAGGHMALLSLEIESRFDRFAGVTRYPDGSYHAYEQMKQWNKLAFHTSGKVTTSIFSDGVSNGAPPVVMANFLRLFSFDVDFQRDVHPNDEFETVFERYQDRNGKLVHTGELLFAGLTLQGKPHEIFRFGGEYGDGQYYDRTGSSLERALLRTPIDGARLTSGFGNRRDPFRGYKRSHGGIDFAAPVGTPIRAAGDGVLTFVGRQRGYGRFITVRHNDEFTTAYAHMSRFAQGMQEGRRVKQGQIIAYVGTSGRSTGPHLHYEVRQKGKRVNPLNLQLPNGKKLEGDDLLHFQEQVAAIEAFRRGAGGALADASTVRF